jgi:hypothetical protein
MKNPAKMPKREMSAYTRPKPLPSISLAGPRPVMQNAAMMRRAACLFLALAAAGCAAQGPRAPRPTMNTIPPAPPRGEPAQYINLTPASLQGAFGKPAFVRKDGAVEMWRYDGASCRAFFFLSGTPALVHHVETLPRTAQAGADIGCLNALRAAPAKTS